ncbi:alpha/beta hydrolase family protein [Kordiimonas marina]|uniref:alpha/beta hydrolase family protein n=1 Tax=Kordiimonas marina TaxID=2872312 RepID=UPI001FF1E879|nr:alpha/beta fold hydrolase [Kordiimonas marina]MCJ9428522.1 prolyl oligopeptidase family serine peptidase [Kordiimonas marina]
MRWSVLVGLMVWASVPARATGDPKLLTELTRPALYAAVSLSSDGHYLAALKRKGDQQALVVWNAAKKPESADVLPYDRAELNWLAWVGGGRLLISLNEHGLVLYDAHIGRLRPLIEHGGPRPEDLPPVLLSALPDDPTTILMQWEDDAVEGYPAVYRVNAVTGESRKVVSAWKPVIRWWASPSGQVALGEGFRGRRQLLYSRQADGSWRKIADHDYFKDPPLDVLAVEAGGATALVLSGHASNTRELWRMNIRSGTMLQKLAGDGRFDMAAAILDPETDLAVGASFTADGTREIIWQGNTRRQLSTVAGRLGVHHLGLFGSSRDGRRELYHSYNPRGPIRYYLYDRDADTLNAIPHDTAEDSWPAPKESGVWIPVGKKGQQQMHAVLSVPKDGATGRAVVLVHGGPVSRASVGYDPLVTWLTAAGYTVLQPNFRGSSGFGEAWRRAGYGEWGRDMQDDVRTAGEWLVKTGRAKAGSLCVMGGSYGGYAALMSSIKDYDLYACAVSLNGVTSIPHLIAFLEKHRFYKLTVPRIRGHQSDYVLSRLSPLYRASLVRTPVLMLHSTEDGNVPYEEGRQMALMLHKYHKDFNFITLKGARHQLTKPEDRRTYYQAALDFLDAHIGPHAHD